MRDHQYSLEFDERLVDECHGILLGTSNDMGFHLEPLIRKMHRKAALKLSSLLASSPPFQRGVSTTVTEEDTTDDCNFGSLELCLHYRHTLPHKLSFFSSIRSWC